MDADDDAQELAEHQAADARPLRAPYGVAPAARADAIRARAVERFGDPNQALSNSSQLRFGRNGSVAVELTGEKAGQWFDHANGVGGLLAEAKDDRSAVNGTKARIVAEHDYRDECGKLLFQVVRMSPKAFRQRRPDGKGGWDWSVKGVRWVLYRLAALLASDAGEPVFVVEGEKDADRLAELGLVATCNAGGAGKWLPEYNEHFRGRTVYVVSDNDSAGRKHAENVAAHLQGVAASVRIVELPDLPPKGDVSDFLDAGNDAATLRARCEAPPEWRPCDARSLAPVDGLEITRVADVETRPIEWLWPNRIAIGKINLVCGDPGLGKSTVTLDMAARVTRGGTWPVDGSRCPLGSVLLVTAEDNIADTIRPRLEAAGADVNRVHCVGLVKDKNRRRGLSLQEDVARLGAQVEALGDCRLVVIDPVSAYLGSVDSHNNADVRGVLAELAEMAARTGVAVVLVTHLNKGGERSNAMYRATGSLAFVAAARSAWVVARHHQDPRHRLFLPIKNNLACDASGLAYRVVTAYGGAPYISWERDPVGITADEALSGAPAGPKPRDEAIDWLRDRLADGPVKATDIWDEARANGYAEATVKRAKKQLGVEATKQEGELSGGWSWRLPGYRQVREVAEGDHSGPEVDHFSRSRKVDPLRRCDPLRRGSLAEEDHRKALGKSDPLAEPQLEPVQREVVEL